MTLERKKERTVVFISHATHEDDEFARWLSLQLSRRGYEAWCDVTKLLGGEPWWKDIEEAIGQFACKFLLVASQVSVKKGGVIREVKLARSIPEKLKNFIIPVRIDGVPYRDFPEGIGGELNAVDFSAGWAAGLAKLLKRLEEDEVPKNEAFNADTVSDYWRKCFPSAEGIAEGRETHLSNWFPITDLPQEVYIHRSSVFSSKNFKLEDLRSPAEVSGENLITFMEKQELQPFLRKSGARLRSSRSETVADFLESGHEEAGIRAAEARNFIRSILRKGWNLNAVARGFKPYELANKDLCFWVEKGFRKGDEYAFLDPAGREQKRQLVGYKSIHAAEGVTKFRYWHFAIQGRPVLWPQQIFAVRTHVVFTEDGRTLIESSAKQHSARRSQCKNWWNDTWRDRLMAAVAAMARQNPEVIDLPLSADAVARVSVKPELFESSVQYAQVEKVPIEDVPEVDDFEEDEETDEEKPT